ncbi:MAG: TRAP transporter large permease [Pseudomonadota bacterium]
MVGSPNWVAKLPGGLLQTNIAGCAVFASVSGSSIATAASIGGVALPQLIRRNYNRPLAAGSLAAGGTLGILLPPSFGMIVYGTFHRDLGPEAVHGRGRPRPDHDRIVHELYRRACQAVAACGAPRAGLTLVPRALRALGDVLPFALLITGTLGGIYAGLVTTTEGATIGCILAMILGALWGDLRLAGVIEAMHNTVKFSGNILFIIFVAYIFSYAISFAGIGEAVTQFIVSRQLSRLEFFLALFVLYTMLGCLIESIGMIVITVPLIFPVLPSYGISPIMFGVILVLFVELGQISPPIGINLFVIQSIWDGKLSEVVTGTIPFHLIMFVVLALVILCPELALWLPGRVGH